jgi:hypothetical protein
MNRPALDKQDYRDLALNSVSPSGAHESRRSGIGGTSHVGAAIRGQAFEEEVNCFGGRRG